MSHLEITDIFIIPTTATPFVGEIDETFKDEFTVGERIKISQPDGTYFFSEIRGVEKFQTVSGRKQIGVLLDAAIGKEDVLRGAIIESTNS